MSLRIINHTMTKGFTQAKHTLCKISVPQLSRSGAQNHVGMAKPTKPFR
jgi:hypothetical protein